ncbi:MAG TPA: nuclear transport factor 2 family protein [Bacteroidetes bacterium]|nr:nuclear transport factor 2 family protein [Bacteroidota bacterium]HIL58430.1 nuclear transport factor 2 family protein [Rhodothermales bacterium]
MTLHDHATRLQELAAGPAILDAVDQFYADDVVIVEATGESFTGKETQKERVREFMGSVAEMHDGGIRSIAAHETAPGTGIAFAETWTDMTFQDGSRLMLEEVAVQTWENGKVVRERFYYDTAPGADA